MTHVLNYVIISSHLFIKNTVSQSLHMKTLSIYLIIKVLSQSQLMIINTA